MSGSKGFKGMQPCRVAAAKGVQLQGSWYVGKAGPTFEPIQPPHPPPTPVGDDLSDWKVDRLHLVPTSAPGCKVGRALLHSSRPCLTGVRWHFGSLNVNYTKTKPRHPTPSHSAPNPPHTFHLHRPLLLPSARRRHPGIPPPSRQSSCSRRAPWCLLFAPAQCIRLQRRR